ncbi:MAG TPA: folate-binding protein [Nodosilinea sp.]|nr:folate-binding protein [Nodosilinea sp.]
MPALQDLQQAQGASFTAEGVPLGFGDAAAALEATTTGAVLIDRSHWGVIEMRGCDRTRFIHNQTTNTFTQRQPGEGCDTVFVTSTARTLDLATVYITEDSLILLVSPGQDQRLIDWMDRYIFPADQVSLKNLTGDVALFSLVGPQALPLLTTLGLEIDPQLPDGHHQTVDINGLTLRLAAGSGLALGGYSLLVPAATAAEVWQLLTTAGALPAGEHLWQQLRVQQGRPSPGAELTDDYNPLEAGLWPMISFDKGCYIGQETIARLNTYQGVKQQLWGLQLSGPVEPGAIISVGDEQGGNEKVGLITSCVDLPSGPMGLGYLRTKAGGAGLSVTVGGVSATVVEVPFLGRGYLANAN